jgi:hypothetical protein
MTLLTEGIHSQIHRSRGVMKELADRQTEKLLKWVAKIGLYSLGGG